MLKSYLRIAWRNITRHKVFTLINVSGLALGICACIVIFLVTNHELSYDTFHPDKERIYHVGTKEQHTTWNTSRVPPPMPAALQQEITGVEAVAKFYPYWPTITIRGMVDQPRSYGATVAGSDQTSVILTDPQYFTIFKYDWLAGNPASSLKDPFKVVLAESKVRKYFGDLPYDKVIGKELVYDDSIKVSVAGIVKDWNKNTDFPFTEFLSFSTIDVSSLRKTYRYDTWGPIRGSPWIWLMVKLSKNSNPVQFNSQLAALLKRHIPNNPDRRLTPLLQPLSDIHFNAEYSHDDTRKAHLPSLYALMGIALFILLLAVINFINLSTAQSIQRAKEIGVRKVLGSGRLSLVAQFLTETFVVSLFAVAMAILMVNPVLTFFRDFIPAGLAFHPFNTGTLAFILLLTLVTSLLAGLYPAKVLSSYAPILSLKGDGGPRGGEKWWLRKGLIVFQFSISLIFIIGTLVIGRQIRYMQNTDLGFKTDAILSVYTSWRDTSNRVRVFAEKIRQVPGVENVILQQNPPTGWGKANGDVTFLGKRPVKLRISVFGGNEAFIPFYGMRLIAGRNLIHSDSLQEFIINETYLSALGFTRPEEALGQFLQYGDNVRPIVGVVADFHESSFHDPIEPMIIGHFPEGERNVGIQLAARGQQAGHVKSTLAAIGKIWTEIYPREEFDYRFIDKAVASFYEDEQKTSRLITAATLITIFISCLGLYGLTMFTAQKRTKEIGIRKIIGAGTVDIVTLLSKDFVLLVCIAFFIASPVAWYFMHNWLDGFAYRITIHWWIFAEAGAGALFIAVLTVSFLAVKAALANPVKSLRAE